MAYDAEALTQGKFEHLSDPAGSGQSGTTSAADEDAEIARGIADATAKAPWPPDMSAAYAHGRRSSTDFPTGLTPMELRFLAAERQSGFHLDDKRIDAPCSLALAQTFRRPGHEDNDVRRARAVSVRTRA